MSSVYYFEHGLRKVYPYQYIRQIFCKERWLNRTVDSIFQEEIRELVLDERRVSSLMKLSRKQAAILTKLYQKKEYENGKIVLIRGRGRKGPESRINGIQVASELLQNGDIIEYSSHIHEPPVIQQTQIDIILETPDTLVINKPAGVPIHPTGRYMKNSLTSILENDLGYKVYGMCC